MSGTTWLTRSTFPPTKSPSGTQLVTARSSRLLDPSPPALLQTALTGTLVSFVYPARATMGQALKTGSSLEHTLRAVRSQRQSLALRHRGIWSVDMESIHMYILLRSSIGHSMLVAKVMLFHLDSCRAQIIPYAARSSSITLLFGKKAQRWASKQEAVWASG
jgi:hypothetical protein